jgi:hypothetical protein
MKVNDIVRFLAGTTATGIVELAEDLRVNVRDVALAYDTDHLPPVSLRVAVAREVGLLASFRALAEQTPADELEAERTFLQKRINEIDRAVKRGRLRDDISKKIVDRQVAPTCEPISTLLEKLIEEQE